MGRCFGQLVIGPPGSGKSTYCREMVALLRGLGRKVALVNLDPANDPLPPDYKADLDIANLIRVEEVMEEMGLGPNAALVFALEYLEKNEEWVREGLGRLPGHYLVIDCPGQVELYTHHPSLKRLLARLASPPLALSLASVLLLDSHSASEPGKFLSSLLHTLTAMLNLELPHVSALSKVDTMARFAHTLPFSLEYYAEVMDLSYLLEWLSQDPLHRRYALLNEAIVHLVEDFSLVSFLPLTVKDKRTLVRVQRAADKANGYVYGAGEEASVEALLACAVAAQSDHERLGLDHDLYST